MSRQTSLINLIEDATRDGSWIVQEQCIQRVDAIGDSNTFAELLIRLPDGNGGMIAPSDFLPAAERYGLMQEIDLWMCNHALARIAATLQAGAAKLYSVNISASSVSSGRFRRSVLDLLGAAPEQVRKLLCFEVTETAILTNYDGCRQFLANLRTLGASVAIDDFGAGSTSFRHFQHLPADYLKIDGSFIQNMNNPIEAASIQCFLRMAEVANFQTIAEHVEDEGQIAALAALKVDFLQGFALGRPE
jgi:EAL domain-containing protein (putative c-di-GMP-specific phosphodiesterase class I)